MCTKTLDTPQLSLLILRLMDADFLLLEQGSDLLAEIEASDTEVRNSEIYERLLTMLGAPAQTGCLLFSTAGQVQEIIDRQLPRAREPN
jgi:hypothetical protein